MGNSPTQGHIMRDYHYNPTQAGFDVLKACDTFRKVLYANIDPLLPLERKVEAKAKIRCMDYNELRAAVAALNKR